MKIIAALKYTSFDEYHRPIVRTIIDERFNSTDENYDLEYDFSKDSEYLQVVNNIRLVEDGEDTIALIKPSKNSRVEICIPYSEIILWINYDLLE